MFTFSKKKKKKKSFFLFINKVILKDQTYYPTFPLSQAILFLAINQTPQSANMTKEWESEID